MCTYFYLKYKEKETKMRRPSAMLAYEYMYIIAELKLKERR